MPKKNPYPTQLEAARRAAGLTRQELSKLTGISCRTIEAYEQQKNDFNMAAAVTVKKIAAAIGVPMESIIE